MIGGDVCVALFGAVYGRGDVPIPIGASVLEIGCAEDDWMTPMLAERPDLQITGIDWRSCARPGTVIRGDVLTHVFPAATFDAAVGISSIEHIGLGHYDADPADPEGDRRCMERIVSWVKPGGAVYLDVPYDPEGYSVQGTSHRVYDEAAVATRLVVPGLVERARWYSYVCHSTPGELHASCPPPRGGMMRVVALVLERVV